MSEPDLVLGENDYLLLLWFMNLPEPVREKGELGSDMLGYVVRPGGPHDGNWRLTWRFRYYRDEKAWESQDRKSWYDAVLLPMPEQKVKQHIERFTSAIVQATGVLYGEVLRPEIFYVRGDGRKLQALVDAGRVPAWMHGVPTRKANDR